MRSRNLNPTAGSGDAKEFGDKGHYVRHVLSDVTADYFVELIIGKWIRKDAEIVDYIGVGARV
jgi:hypothetical protein